MTFLRYLRQSIVSKEPLIQSSAAVAGIRLFGKSPDVIRRWLNEVQEAVKVISHVFINL